MYIFQSLKKVTWRNKYTKKADQQPNLQCGLDLWVTYFLDTVKMVFTKGNLIEVEDDKAIILKDTGKKGDTEWLV